MTEQENISALVLNKVNEIRGLLQGMRKDEQSRELRVAEQVVISNDVVADNLAVVSKKTSQDEIINKFLEQSPNISRIKISPDQQAVELTEKPLTDDDMVTETLAQIYVKQKHFSQAIETYRKLSLKFPEKSIYFAAQISELEKLI